MRCSGSHATLLTLDRWQRAVTVALDLYGPRATSIRATVTTEYNDEGYYLGLESFEACDSDGRTLPYDFTTAFWLNHIQELQVDDAESVEITLDEDDVDDVVQRVSCEYLWDFTEDTDWEIATPPAPAVPCPALYVLEDA